MPQHQWADHLCERDLKTEGPCFGPRMSPEERGPADQVVGGRYLCPNHVLTIYGTDEYYGARDPETPYWISENGFYEGPVEKGDYAKVMFAPVGPEASAEGMWVKVRSIRNGVVTGFLKNQPVDPEGVGARFGQTVHFPRRAIRTVMSAQEEAQIRAARTIRGE